MADRIDASLYRQDEDAKPEQTLAGLALSLLDVRGQIMAVDQRRRSVFEEVSAIDRDDLIVPELLVEDVESPPATILKPAIDAVWQAAGWKGSLNYDSAGVWLKS